MDQDLHIAELSEIKAAVDYNRQLLEKIRGSMVEYECDELSQANLENDICEMLAHRKEPNMLERTRVLMGYSAEGKPLYKRIAGRTQDDRNDAIVRAYIQSGRIWEFIRKAGYEVHETESHASTEFSEYAWDYYKRYKEGTLAENSKVRMISTIKTLSKFFAGKSIESITTADVQDFMNSRAADGVASTTINDNVKLLRQILSSAIEDGIRLDNPAKSSRLSNGGKQTDGTQAIPIDQFKRIVDGLSKVKDAIVQMALAILCYTGVRREEMLGLQWEDVDFDKKQLHIQRAVTYPKGAPLVKEPKTKAGNRIIPMPDALIRILKPNRKESGYIVADGRENPLSDYELKRLHQELQKATNISGVTCKMFRTTFATVMAATGKIDPKKLQAIMGHEKIQTTLDIYAKHEKALLNINRNALAEFFDDVAV